MQEMANLEVFWKVGRTFRCRQPSDAQVTRIKKKLYGLLPASHARHSEDYAKVLCYYFLNDYPLFRAVASNDKELFTKYCRCKCKIQRGAIICPMLEWGINRLWSAFEEIMLPKLKSL